MPISDLDLDELLLRACGKTHEEAEKIMGEDEYWETLDELAYEKFQVGPDEFNKIVRALLPFTPCIKTVIGGKLVHAFVDAERQCSIVSMEAAKKE